MLELNLILGWIMLWLQNFKFLVTIMKSVEPVTASTCSQETLAGQLNRYQSEVVDLLDSTDSVVALGI